jgi:uncharacterized membrane protein
MRKLSTLRLWLGLTLLALLLRFYLLGNQSLWIDEAYSLAQIRLPWSALITPGGYEEIHPPLYYLTAKPLSGLVAPSSAWFEALLRLPSALFSALGVLAICWVGQLLFDRTTGALAGLFYAISAFSIWYGQELRMYSLALLLVTLQVGLAVRAARDGASRRDWLLLFLVSVAASLTHWYAVLVWPALLLFLVSDRPGREQWGRLGVLLFSVAAATCIYLVPKFLEGRGEMAGSSDWKNIAYTVWSFWVGYSAGPSVVDLHSRPFEILARFTPSVATLSALAALVSGMGGWVLWRRASRREVMFLSGWLLVGLFVPFILAVAAGKIFNARYSFTAFPAMILLLGAAASHLRTPATRIVFIGAILVSQLWSIGNYYWNPYYWREDFRSVARTLQQEPSARGRVLLSLATRDTLSAYGIEGWEWRVYPHWRPWSQELQQAIDGRRQEDGEIWHVTGRRWWEEEKPVREYLNQELPLDRHAEWVGLDLWVFRPEE